MADFKNKVVYQIYPKSFKDSNGDGIGDLRAVIDALDYLADMGVDYLWLTPFFVSPQKDNGYDIADFDVINLVAKPEVFADDTQGLGRRLFADGPHIHEYLQELVHSAGIGDMVTVGEMASTDLENCIHYTRPANHELSMTFSFHHLKVDYKDGDKWALMPPDMMRLKQLFAAWQTGMAKAGSWNALFWCNHDQPRIVSRLGDDKEYREASAKMLAACIHLMRGAPYIYQGEELGMTNAGYTSIADYRDVESLNYYRILREQGKTVAGALTILAARSRDNGRTPMQWSAGQYAGFSTREPWIPLSPGVKPPNSLLMLHASEQKQPSVPTRAQKAVFMYTSTD